MSLAKSVMVVDNCVASREVMGKILGLGGYSVVAEAANGIDAVEKYKRYRPALTLMDVVMPQKNGLDATRAILSLNHRAKVVMCTFLDNESLAAAAADAGACGIIMKPFLYEQVHEVLDAVMEG